MFYYGYPFKIIDGVRPIIHFRKTGPFYNIVNGKYPVKPIDQMRTNCLENLLNKLVLTTNEILTMSKKNVTVTKPKWWLNSLNFAYPLHIKPKSDKEKKLLRLLIKQTIRSCANFFKKLELNSLQDVWCETDRSVCILPPKTKSFNNKLIEINNTYDEPEPLLEDCSDSNSNLSLNQNEFMQHLGVFTNNSIKPSSDTSKNKILPKLANFPNIPVSSDLGKLLISSENYHVPENVKLKRLERTEWFINRDISNKSNNNNNSSSSEINYEISWTRKTKCNHIYKMPKRQYHQKHPSFYSEEFLSQFCCPVTINVEQMDLEKQKLNKTSDVS